jgi:hypothetical protein
MDVPSGRVSTYAAPLGQHGIHPEAEVRHGHQGDQRREGGGESDGEEDRRQK